MYIIINYVPNWSWLWLLSCVIINWTLEVTRKWRKPIVKLKWAQNLDVKSMVFSYDIDVALC